MLLLLFCVTTSRGMYLIEDLCSHLGTPRDKSHGCRFCASSDPSSTAEEGFSKVCRWYEVRPSNFEKFIELDCSKCNSFCGGRFVTRRKVMGDESHHQLTPLDDGYLGCTQQAGSNLTRNFIYTYLRISSYNKSDTSMI